jgi:hypothetical protein
MTAFETDGNPWLSRLAGLWEKLDGQIRRTHRNLEKLVEMKIRIEQELSRNGQDTASDQSQVTAQELEHFQAVRQEATRNIPSCPAMRWRQSSTACWMSLRSSAILTPKRMRSDGHGDSDSRV